MAITKTLLAAALFLLVAVKAYAGCGNTGQSVCYVDVDIASTCTNYDPSTELCSGGSYKAYKQIQDAASVVSAGDTVIVADGVYTDTNADSRIVSLARGGTSTNWITFKAKNKWAAVLDGGSQDAEYCWINTTGANYLNIEDFEMRDCIKAMHNNSVNHDITIYRNYIHDIGRVLASDLSGRSAIFAGVGTYNFTFDSNIFHSIGRLHYYTSPQAVPGGTLAQNEATCTYTDGTKHCYQHDHPIYVRGTNSIITNNITYDIKSGWAIQVSPECVDTYIINNTFYGANPGRDGQIMLWNSPAIMDNNVFASPSNYAIVCANHEGTSYVRNNLSSVGLIKTSGSDSCATGTFSTSSNIINTDPKLVSPTTDFTLQASSPAINTGLATNAPTYDYAGVARSSPPEIGAYEYGTTADTEPPSIPPNVLAADTGSTTMHISWGVTTDNVGVTGYKIYRGGAQIYSGAVLGNVFNDSGLTPDTEYCYTVAAYDSAGNVSAQSTQSCDFTDPLPSPVGYTLAWGSSTTKTSCADFSGANSTTVGDYQTWKVLRDFTTLYICVDSTDTDVLSSCLRDGACEADDSIKVWLSPTNNTGDPVGTDITLIISFNGEKKDSDVTSGTSKDIGFYSRVTQAGGHTYVWAAIPFSELYTSLPSSGTVWGLQTCEINGSTQTYTEKCATKTTMTFGSSAPAYPYGKIGN